MSYAKKIKLDIVTSNAFKKICRLLFIIFFTLAELSSYMMQSSSWQNMLIIDCYIGGLKKTIAIRGFRGNQGIK